MALRTDSTGTNSLKMAGLVSGMDTEAMVKQMSASTKLKINTNQQKLDKLSWKQDAYRSIISKISTFKSTYFNILNPSKNLSANATFNAMKAAASSSSITVSASTTASVGSMKITGITQKATSAKIESASNFKVVDSIKIDNATGESGKDYTVNVTLDGLSKDITFSGNVKDSLLNELNSAFGSGTFQYNSNGSLEVVDKSLMHNFTIKSSSNVDSELAKASLDILGLDGTTSNKLSTNSKLKDLDFGVSLNGNGFEFSINGVDFKFDGDATVSQVMSKINSSKAGVTVAFNSVQQKFTMTASQSGQAGEINITQTSGNLLSAMFGSDKISAGSNVNSNSLVPSSITSQVNTLGDITQYRNSTITVEVNGVKKEIGIWGYDSNGTKIDYSSTDKLITQLNTELTNAFGSSAPSFKFNDDKTISLSGSAGDDIKITASVDAKGNVKETSEKLLSALGFSEGQTNSIDTSSKISDLLGGLKGTFTVDGTEITIDENTTIESLVSSSGGKISFNEESGMLTISGAVTTADDDGDKIATALFGDYKNLDFSTTGNGTLNSVGQNAVIEIDGVKMTNVSNSITLNGVTINLDGMSEADINKVNSGEAITITTSRDTSQAFDSIVGFVNDYNKLIEELYGEINTARPKSSGSYYEPLTEEQMEEMSEKEIEKWEEKAKQGMLYQDSTINGFLTKLRSTLSTRTSDGFSIYELGISISSTYSENGKLSIDETKLKAALETNADKVRELFAGENGLSAKMTTAIDSAASTSRTTGYGSLVKIAGVANTATQAENSISKQIDTFTKLVETLKSKYETEQARYWKMFTNMETTLNNYNSQSSWLTSQFSQ